MTKKNKLVAYKQLYDLTWKDLADKIGITQANLHKIATGKVTNIKMETINKIRKATGLEPSDYIKK